LTFTVQPSGKPVATWRNAWPNLKNPQTGWSGIASYPRKFVPDRAADRLAD
jgi:hypothetical protein